MQAIGLDRTEPDASWRPVYEAAGMTDLIAPGLGQPIRHRAGSWPWVSPRQSRLWPLPQEAAAG